MNDADKLLLVYIMLAAVIISAGYVLHTERRNRHDWTERR